MSKDVEILIVEGNLDESEHLKHILEQHEYRVTVELNGKAALDAARTNPSQIVISAVPLPEMDSGTSAIEKAQTASPLSSEELLDFMLEGAKDYSIFTTDAEGRVTSWNAGAERFFGYSKAEILGQNGAILFTPEDREIGAPEQELSTAVTEGRATDERWHLRKDGTRLWLGVMVRPHRNDAGRLQGFIKIGRDMTEQKRAEDALRRRERELSDFVDNANVGMQWIDGDGIIKWANKTELDLLGYTPEEYIGHHVAEFHADREVIENILERLTGDEALNDQEARLRCKDGTFRNVLVNSNVFWEDGKFVHTRCFTRDITERKQAENTLIKETALNKLLQMIAVAANEATDIKDAAQICLDKVCDLTKWQLGHLILLAEDSSDDLVSADLWHIRDRERFEKFKVGTGRMRWSKGNGLAGQILKTGKPIWMVDVAKERPFIRKQWAKEAGIVSAFAFPILVQAKVMGVLEFFSTAKEEPDEKLLAVMNSIGNQLGQVIERKQAEEALRQSEANLAAAQRITHLGSWELDILDLEDSSKNPVHCSDEVYRIFGYEPGQIEITGEVFYSFVRSHEQTRIREALVEAVKQQTDLNIEFSIVLPDARERIVHLQAEVIYDEQSNKSSKLIGTIQDITERKQAEQTVRESEARYRIVTESASDAIVTIDVENTILFINPAAEKIFGYALDEMLGNNLSMLMPEKFRGAHTAGIKRYAATGKRNITWKGVEVPALHKDGHEVPVEITFGELYLDGKHLFTAVIRDITNRKLAREALEKSERQYRFLSEGIMHQVWTAQPDGKLDYVNGRMLEYFGLTFEQVINDGWQSVVHPDDLRICNERGTKSLETGGDYEVEFRLKKADGTYRWHSGRATAGCCSDGKIVKWFGTNTDIHDKKLAEEELKLSVGHLQQSQKMEAIGTLTGGVAHDFNNLLTAILGNTQLAQRKLEPDDPIQLRLAEVAYAGGRAAELTRKLLAFSHRQYLERRIVNLNDTIGEIMTLLKRIIGEDVEVSVKYGDDLPTVFADPGQIGQVVMNLSVNARDAMPSGGRLTIETSCVELDESYCRQYPDVVPGRYVEIRVSDSGTGMDGEIQAHIFEPYFTTKEVGKGTGLGLSMAYGIIRQHDGHINLYSELGLGTTFKVYLPMDTKIVEEKVPAIPPSFLGGTETILVAEDEEPLRNLAKDALEELGYTVLLAKNGEEAVEIFGANRERIDLFLSDVIMPQMSGSEAFERIREMGGNIPLIFMTGYSSETVQSRLGKPKKTAEELGAVVILKPYSLEKLGRTVREVLDKNYKL